VAARAFILIETAVGKNKDIIRQLKLIKGVNSVNYVTGPYDIIAIIEAENLNEVGDIVTRDIHPIAGINRTTTCLALKID
jgi:DNA-binding Lrp family transcriptional regulator